ncbi:hypothetical protein WN944_017938 [Citrus x changshan-huyou]|uniref:Uncharacterized protein n=1 Tax=Citrus x changshan-huyou TaxID=2935761 RepID=A0AAP0LVV8_9ROSI
MLTVPKRKTKPVDNGRVSKSKPEDGPSGYHLDKSKSETEHPVSIEVLYYVDPALNTIQSEYLNCQTPSVLPINIESITALDRNPSSLHYSSLCVKIKAIIATAQEIQFQI